MEIQEQGSQYFLNKTGQGLAQWGFSALTILMDLSGGFAILRAA
jgi:hypothetical protein